MADDDKDDRTEAPSHRRLEQAREEGNVPVSRDVVSLATFAAGALTIASLGSKIVHALVQLVSASLGHLDAGRVGDLQPLMVRPGTLIITICGMVSLAGLVASLAQTRLGFWPELAFPKLDRVFSGGKFSRIFKKETLADLGLVLVKIVALGWSVWWALRDEFVTLPRMFQLQADGLLAAMFGPLGNALSRVLVVLFLLAGADLAVTILRFRGKLKMTKEELKREYKEDEGDPMFRSRRRRRHRELVKGRIAADVPKADVVVVNPTHIAIALRYRPEEDRAPRVIAKGKGGTADKIRELAREHGIPIVQDIPLARLLYKRVKIGRSVPAETFKAVAAILAFVYRALGRTNQAAAKTTPINKEARP